MDYIDLLKINIQYLKKKINKSPYCCMNEDYSTEDTQKLISLNKNGFYTTHFSYKSEEISNKVEIKSYIEGFIDNLYIDLIIENISKMDDIYYLIDNSIEKKSNIPFIDKNYSLTRYKDNNNQWCENSESIPENWEFYNDKTSLFKNNKKYFINKSYLILVSKNYNYNKCIISILQNIIKLL